MSDERNGATVDPNEEVAHIIRTARLLGVEVDETDVAQWLTAMAAAQFESKDWAIDEEVGIFGHRITLLDFELATLQRYRRIADIVQLPDTPNIETAISLSGSAAQGRIQRYPGDCDYFERVNIKAATREEACRLLGQLMREKALAFLKGPTYDLIEVRFGTWKTDVVRDGKPVKAGSSITWRPEEVQAGKMEVFRPDGQPWTVEWSYGELDPGWCKMDWVIAEPEEGRVVNASNMLDVTWETPEGEIVPLDGFLDPYFQEVYLEAESIPLFSKLAQRVSPQALGEYVYQLTEQVRKYTHGNANYGKAAKRLYNIFRLTGQHEAAALIRELFDEPAALLYQVWSLIDTLDDAGRSDSSLDREAVISQMDQLIREVIDLLEGPQETGIVMALLRLRDSITGVRRLEAAEWSGIISSSREQVEEEVNNYFRAKLLAIPQVVAFLERMDQSA